MIIDLQSSDTGTHPDELRWATLLDESLPVFEFVDAQSIVIRASPAAILAAYRALTIGDIPLFGLLVRLRGLPDRLSGGLHGSLASARRFLDLALSPGSGWILLGEAPGGESVIGSIGRYAQLRIAFLPPEDAAAFKAFADPRYTKIALGLRVIPGGDPNGRHTVVMETRTHVPDRQERRRFAAYWLVIKPFEGLMARGALRALKRRAEAAGNREEVLQ